MISSTRLRSPGASFSRRVTLLPVLPLDSAQLASAARSCASVRLPLLPTLATRATDDAMDNNY
jgi:hypothetical protein